MLRKHTNDGSYLLLPIHLDAIGVSVLLSLRDSLASTAKYNGYVRLLTAHAEENLYRTESFVGACFRLRNTNRTSAFVGPSVIEAKDERERHLVNSVPPFGREGAEFAFIFRWVEVVSGVGAKHVTKARMEPLTADPDFL